MAYIIETLTVEERFIEHNSSGLCPGGDTKGLPPEVRQFWQGTYATETEAQAVFDSLAKRRNILSAVLVHWKPSENEPSDTMPATGNYADRHCLGSTEHAIRYGERTWERYSTGSGDVTNAHDDWRESNVAERSISTAGGGRWKLSPKRKD